MSKGFGKVQRSIAALIRAEPDGAWAYEHLTERIYGTDRFTRAQKNAIGRALAAMRLPGTWEVWQASFQNDRRLWLFDPCNLESWRKIAAGWDPAHFQPGGVIFRLVQRGAAPGPGKSRRQRTACAGAMRDHARTLSAATTWPAGGGID
jgi:hypothetical protein